MRLKIDILSVETIKPSSPTPLHRKNYKLSFIDQSISGAHVPVLLFYSASDVNSVPGGFTTISEILKKSLSKTLTRFYPLAGQLVENSSVDCSDYGVIFKKVRANITLSKIMKNPEVNDTEKLFPFHPYRFSVGEEEPITGVQLNLFDCGGIGIGVCVSHTVADGTTIASFLAAWAATATGNYDNEALSPCLDSADHFPPREFSLVFQLHRSLVSEKIVTRRFEFTPKSLSNLETKFGIENPSRTLAVTALLWKTAITVNCKKSFMTIASHAVNLRPRMDPPLPENSFGNLFQMSDAPLAVADKDLELEYLAVLLKKSILRINGKYVDELRENDGALKAVEMQMIEDVEFYRFSSWTRFAFYETDFGWGKPIWVCTSPASRKNTFFLLGTKFGGVEVWANLDENDMVEFEKNEALLQFI